MECWNRPHHRRAPQADPQMAYPQIHGVAGDSAVKGWLNIGRIMAIECSCSARSSSMVLHLACMLNFYWNMVLQKFVTCKFSENTLVSKSGLAVEVMLFTSAFSIFDDYRMLALISNMEKAHTTYGWLNTWISCNVVTAISGQSAYSNATNFEGIIHTRVMDIWSIYDADVDHVKYWEPSTSNSGMYITRRMTPLTSESHLPLLCNASNSLFCRWYSAHFKCFSLQAVLGASTFAPTSCQFTRLQSKCPRQNYTLISCYTDRNMAIGITTRSIRSIFLPWQHVYFKIRDTRGITKPSFLST